MQFHRRQLAPNELDHELIWLSVSLASFACAGAWLGFGLPWPQCVFHHVTGLPCITCGMTRSAMAFFHGDLLRAFNWNPLIFVSLCGLSIFDFYAFAVVITRAPRLRISFSAAAQNYGRGTMVGALALNWMYLLAHWQKF